MTAQVLFQKPVSKVSIKEICDLSEMSRSTFYLHYHDQFELLEDIENEVLEKTFENLKNIDSPMNTLESIEAFLNYVKKHRTTFGILLCQPENKHFQESIIQSVQSYVQASIPEIKDSDHADYVFTFIMHGSLNAIKVWIENKFDIDESELAQVIYNSCKNIT